MEIPRHLLIKTTTTTISTSYFALGDRMKIVLSPPKTEIESKAQNFIIQTLNSLVYTDGKKINISFVTIYSLISVIFVILLGVLVKFYLSWNKKKKNQKVKNGHTKLLDCSTPRAEFTMPTAPPKYSCESTVKHLNTPVSTKNFQSQSVRLSGIKQTRTSLLRIKYSKQKTAELNNKKPYFFYNSGNCF